MAGTKLASHKPVLGHTASVRAVLRAVLMSSMQMGTDDIFFFCCCLLYPAFLLEANEAAFCLMYLDTYT